MGRRLPTRQSLVTPLVPKPIVPAIGSCRKDAGKSLDPAGKHGKYLEYGSIFRGIPAVSRGTSFTWVVDLFVCF